MKHPPRPAEDTAVSSFTDAIDLCISKLTRFTSGLTNDEMDWRPTGIKNSLSWILTHFTALLWCCHAVITGKRIPFDPLSAGVAWGGINSLDYEKDKQVPPPPRENPVKHLSEAWTAIQNVMEGTDRSWEERQVYSDRKMRTTWYFLTQSLCDFAYHTGQASSLRKLIAVQRRRIKNKQK
jgi:hypothetical protein